MSEDRAGPAAAARREDRLTVGKKSGEIAAAVHREIDSTWRVYRKEWLFDSRHQAEAEAHEHIAHTYAGRLHPYDVKIEGDTSSWVVLTRIWNVESEWKDEQRANTHARTLPERTEVVPRNSRREHQIRQYGILKLPA